MRQRPFLQVDVFTATPYRGNPVAVVLDGEGLSTEQMQAFKSGTRPGSVMPQLAKGYSDAQIEQLAAYFARPAAAASRP